MAKKYNKPKVSKKPKQKPKNSSKKVYKSTKRRQINKNEKRKAIEKAVSLGIERKTARQMTVTNLKQSISSIEKKRQKDKERKERKSDRAKQLREEKRHYLLTVKKVPADKITSDLLNKSWDYLKRISPKRNKKLYDIVEAKKDTTKQYVSSDGHCIAIAWADNAGELDMMSQKAFFDGMVLDELQRYGEEARSNYVKDGSGGRSSVIEVKDFDSRSEAIQWAEFMSLRGYSVTVSDRFTLKEWYQYDALMSSIGVENHGARAHNELTDFARKHIPDLYKTLKSRGWERAEEKKRD